jgi:cysteine desulfurase
MKKNSLIYLDNSATTKVREEVYEAMMPYYTSKYYNPDSLYFQAREVKAEVEKVRQLIAEEIGADADEIFFTSGGCEANTWAMKIFHDKGFKQILTSPIEHHSLDNAIKEYIGDPIYAQLETDNLVADSKISNGLIDIDELEFMLKRLTVDAASIMHGNNEIGTVQSIPLLAGIFEEYNIPFHTDAVQTFMHLPIDVDTMGVKMLSASAHKIGGPKGIGFLYIKRDFQEGIKPLICGGQQEHGVRGGTTNVPAIIGFGKAMEINLKCRNKLFAKPTFGDTIEQALLNANGLDLMFTGSIAKRLPNHISICFRDISGQQLVSLLAEKGIMCSTGSACNSGNPKPSHVLEAINIPKQFINGAIRITYSSDLTEKDAIYVTKAIEDCVNILRRQNEQS